MKELIIFVVFCFFYTINSVEASDSILINSDNFTLDKNNHRATFHSNVVLWFEDLILKTDKLHVIYKMNSDKSSIHKIIIPHRVIASTISHNSAINEFDKTIISDSAEYFADESKLILKGKVMLKSADSIVTTQELIYYINKKTT